MKRVGFENGSFYHVYNRGVDKRRIFMDDQDYSYFLYELGEFNKPAHSTNLIRTLNKNVKGPTSHINGEYADVCCYVLMPNHYHLILRQLKDNGISKLIQKLGTGYTMFFNKKYERKGVLFEGKYKVKPVDSDEYLMHLSRYLHLNPVSLIDPQWKNKGIKAWKKTNDFIKNYRWSSYSAYISSENDNVKGPTSHREILSKDFIMDYFKNSSDKYEKFISSWTQEDKDLIVKGSTFHSGGKRKGRG